MCDVFIYFDKNINKISYYIVGPPSEQVSGVGVCGGVRGRQVERAVSGEDSKVSY